MNKKRIMLSIAMVGTLFCTSHVALGMGTLKIELITFAAPLGILMGGVAGTTAGLILGAQKGTSLAIEQSLNPTKGAVVSGLTGGLVGLPVGMVAGGILGVAIMIVDGIIYEAKRRYAVAINQQRVAQKQIEQEKANQDKIKNL